MHNRHVHGHLTIFACPHAKLLSPGHRSFRRLSVRNISKQSSNGAKHLGRFSQPPYTKTIALNINRMSINKRNIRYSPFYCPSLESNPNLQTGFQNVYKYVFSLRQLFPFPSLRLFVSYSNEMCQLLAKRKKKGLRIFRMKMFFINLFIYHVLELFNQ